MTRGQRRTVVYNQCGTRQSRELLAGALCALGFKATVAPESINGRPTGHWELRVTLVISKESRARLVATGVLMHWDRWINGWWHSLLKATIAENHKRKPRQKKPVVVAQTTPPTTTNTAAPTPQEEVPL